MSQQGFYVNGQWVSTDKSVTTVSELKKEANIRPERIFVVLNANGEWAMLEQDQIIKTGEYQIFEDLPSFRYG